MRFAIIASEKDPAGLNIKDSLLGLFDFEESGDKFGGNSVFLLKNNSNVFENNEKESDERGKNGERTEKIGNKQKTNGRKNEDKIIEKIKSGEKQEIKLYTISSDLICSENLDKKIEADIFIFASKHRAEAGIKTLCCHCIGNFGKADYGGKEKSVCPAPAFLLKNILIELEKNGKGINHEIAIEATHHGPYMEKPAVFMEVGSNEENWGNKEAGNIVAKAIISALEDFYFSKGGENIIERNNETESNGEKANSKKDDEKNNSKNNEKKTNKESNEKINLKNTEKKSALIIGGSHYNHLANKIMLSTDYAVGHICAKYNLENLDIELVRQAMEKTIPNASLVLLDWKGLGKEKERIVKMLEENNINCQRNDKFFD